MIKFIACDSKTVTNGCKVFDEISKMGDSADTWKPKEPAKTEPNIKK